MSDHSHYDGTHSDRADTYAMLRHDPEGLTGVVLDNRFRIEELIGEGQMGYVYRASQIRLRRNVAIKIPRPEISENTDYMRRFEREALTLAQCDHENIVHIYDVHVSDDPALLDYLVMEYVSGEPLDEFIEREQDRLTIGALVDILRQLAEGLDAAHGAGVIHRDIKPANLVVTAPRRTAKIMDFGIAKGRLENIYNTHYMKAVGTPAYMAPEQVRNDPVTSAADIYAFGMTLYRIFARALPFDVDTVESLFYAHVNDDPIPLRQMNDAWPLALEIALGRAIAKKPEHRYPNAMSLMVDVEYALEDYLDEPFGRFFDEEDAYYDGRGAPPLQGRLGRYLGVVAIGVAVVLAAIATPVILSMLDRSNGDPVAYDPDAGRRDPPPGPGEADRTGDRTPPSAPGAGGGTPSPQTPTPPPADPTVAPTPPEPTPTPADVGVTLVTPGTVRVTPQIEPAPVRADVPPEITPTPTLAPMETEEAIEDTMTEPDDAEAPAVVVDEDVDEPATEVEAPEEELTDLARVFPFLARSRTATPSPEVEATPTATPEVEASPTATPTPTEAVAVEDAGLLQPPPVAGQAPTPGPAMSWMDRLTQQLAAVPSPTPGPRPRLAPATPVIRFERPTPTPVPMPTPRPTPMPTPLPTPSPTPAPPARQTAPTPDPAPDWGAPVAGPLRILALSIIDEIIVERIRRPIYYGRFSEAAREFDHVPLDQKDHFFSTVLRYSQRHRNLALSYTRVSDRITERRAVIRFVTGLNGIALTDEDSTETFEIVPPFEAVAVFEKVGRDWRLIQWPRFNPIE